MIWFWWFMLTMVLVIPVTMAVIGLRSLRGRFPPYGSGSGYRTRRSLASPEAWVFAHVYFGRLWVIVGLAVLVPSTVVMLLCPGGDTDRIGLWGGALCFIQTFVMLVPMPLTESALRRMGG